MRLIREIRVKLKKKYRADFICYNKIVLEIKSVSNMHSVLLIQRNKYLKCTGMPLGILVNFGDPSLVYKGIINLPPLDNSYNSSNS